MTTTASPDGPLLNREARRWHVLIVDDNPDNVDILGHLLGEYRRSFALSGEALFARLSKGALPDLILLDVMMPVMDGFTVCQRLKADPLTRDIPIIFVTAMGEEEEQARGFELGAVDYISKPFSRAVVQARVRTHLQLKAARDELHNQNQLLELRVAERTSELQRAIAGIKRGALETIVRLSRAAEFKDEETGQHVLRIGHYAAVVARAMGMGPEGVENLLHAAPMHDIGKIGIPDQILLKPGALDPGERELMKRHTTIGAAILADSDSPVILMAEEVALTHHERWDGLGYPRGLKGEGIPLSGRITSIVDVFDALTSKRPYKEAFSEEEAFSSIEASRSLQFDPLVVDAFMRCRQEVMDIRRTYQNAE